MKKYHAQEGLGNNAENGGSEGACAGTGEAQDQGSSAVEENKEGERVDVGNKESEIRRRQENIRRSTHPVRRPARFKDFVMDNEKRD